MKGRGCNILTGSLWRPHCGDIPKELRTKGTSVKCPQGRKNNKSKGPEVGAYHKQEGTARKMWRGLQQNAVGKEVRVRYGWQSLTGQRGDYLVTLRWGARERSWPGRSCILSYPFKSSFWLCGENKRTETSTDRPISLNLGFSKTY